MHQTSPPTLQVLLGCCRCLWSQGHTAGTHLPLGSSSFPLCPLIPKNLGIFLPQVEQGKGMSSEERQGAQHQLWGGFGVLGAPSSRIPIPKGWAAVQGGRAGGATLSQSLGDKGKEKQQGLILTGQSLGRKFTPCWQSLGQGSGRCWVQRG